MTETFRLERGTAPLVVSFPHVGEEVPAAIERRLTPEARHLPDTDWAVDALYDFVGALGGSRLIARCSRYVVDLNRPPDGASLYPGQAGTGLVPLSTFEDAPLYAPGDVPDDREIAERIASHWRPYHAALDGELRRLREAHGAVLLWDAHSIRTRVPRFFDGALPDLNLGTHDGAACAPGLGEALLAIAQRSPYTAVLNGRFKGGYITRHYGRPGDGVHAVQLELAQTSYMDDAERETDPQRMARLRPVLRALIERALDGVVRGRAGG